MLNRYINLGAIALTLIFGGLALHKIYLSDKGDRYILVFEEPVSGLYIGSEVYINGIPIGTIKKIELDPNNLDVALVTIKTNQAIPKVNNCVAEVCLRSFAGHYGINISYTANEADLGQVNGLKRIKVVQSFMSRGKKKLDSLITEENLDSVVQQVQTTITSVKEAFQEVISMVRKINKVLDDMGPGAKDMDNIFKKMNDCLNDLLPAISKVKTLVNNSNIEQLLNTDLPTLSRILIDVKKVTEVLRFAAKEFNKHPLSYVLKGSQVAAK